MGKADIKVVEGEIKDAKVNSIKKDINDLLLPLLKARKGAGDTKDAKHKQDHTMFDGKAFGISTEEMLRQRDMIAKMDNTSWGLSSEISRTDALRIASTLPNKSVAELLENAEKIEKFVNNKT